MKPTKTGGKNSIFKPQFILYGQTDYSTYARNFFLPNC